MRRRLISPLDDGIAMADAVVRFPPRRMAVVWIQPLSDAWLVLLGEQGWLHGDYNAAIADARWLADNVGLPIRMGQRA
jgi:hypothetical protein